MFAFSYTRLARRSRWFRWLSELARQTYDLKCRLPLLQSANVRSYRLACNSIMGRQHLLPRAAALLQVDRLCRSLERTRVE